MCIRRPRPVRGALVLLILLTARHSLQAGPAPIPWRTNFDSALREAKARERPLWIQFTGPWCIFCRKMDRETFVVPEIVALSRDDFIPVKIRGDEREDLVQYFGIGGLPATIILAPDGTTMLGRREGFADGAEFLGFLFASRRLPVDSDSRDEGAEPTEIALAGYDVVNLIAGRGLSAGEPDLSVRYDGQEFRFVDDADRARFLKEPEKFLPCNRGRCVVSLVDRGAYVPGDPRFGVYYRGRLYLCADAAARGRFAADPSRYADADLGDAGHCPHCRTLAGRLVRGLPQFSAIHQGRRYLFPDPVHLEAFRASPEKFLR